VNRIQMSIAKSIFALAYMGCGFLCRAMTYKEISVFFQVVSVNRRVVKYRPLKGLSPVMGNYHAGFLGGEGP